MTYYEIIRNVLVKNAIDTPTNKQLTFCKGKGFLLVGDVIGVEGLRRISREDKVLKPMLLGKNM